jgi:hypothetical protein
MLHLFNKIYIDQDKFLSNSVKYIKITDAYSFEGVEFHENKVSSYSNYYDFIEGEGSLGDFFEKLLAKEEKIIIYADNFSFAKIITFWYKSITNMDKASFSFFIDCYEHKMDVYSKTNTQTIELSKTFWEEAETKDFSGFSFRPPYEFNFPTCLIDRNSKYIEIFKKTLLSFIKRDYELLILEARKHLDTYILNYDIQKLLGGENKGIKNYKELPRFSVYSEPYWKEIVSVPTFASYQPGSDSKIDLSLTTKEQIKQLCLLTDEINLEIMNEKGSPGATGISSPKLDNNNWKYIDAILRGGLTDEETDTLIQEILDEKIALIYTPFDLRESILFVFLVYVKSLIKQGNLEEAKKFTLK